MIDERGSEHYDVSHVTSHRNVVSHSFESSLLAHSSLRREINFPNSAKKEAKEEKNPFCLCKHRAEERKGARENMKMVKKINKLPLVIPYCTFKLPEKSGQRAV